VIIHCYEEYGVDCLAKLRGMFAFALWDEKEKILFLARDRVGIKPLYYGQTDGSIVFASEIKSLLVDPALRREINLQAVDRFLTYLYLPGDESLFRGIHKLLPGHYLLVKDGRVTCRQFWDLHFERTQSWKNIDEAAAVLSDRLRTTVRDHMISDVPVGFLLSGGVDSTALLSYAVEETGKQIRTFTIGFAGNDFADERSYAKLAADRFGTDHYEITISPDQFTDFLPKFVWHMEEPVCEPPAIALYYVSKLASRHVKVVLSGEGGDEAFGGYQNYRNLLLLETIKKSLGPFAGSVGHLVNTLGRLRLLQRVQKYGPLMTARFPSYYLSRVSSPFAHFNPIKDQLYASNFKAGLGPGLSDTPTRGLSRPDADKNVLEQMLYIDTKTWLPDDLLVKADKISMANSLELRVPLLDHAVLEFAASLPSDYKVKGFALKRVLKRAITKRVPAEIINRKKTGFPVPYAAWFRGELKGYVRDVLLDDTALRRGYFRGTAVEALLDRYERGEALEKEVFSLLILELWHRQFMDSVRHTPEAPSGRRPPTVCSHGVPVGKLP
jgi:asparagine synthase (glutamine-hydrolysing)